MSKTSISENDSSELARATLDYLATGGPAAAILKKRLNSYTFRPFTFEDCAHFPEGAEIKRKLRTAQRKPHVFCMAIAAKRSGHAKYYIVAYKKRTRGGNTIIACYGGSVTLDDRTKHLFTRAAFRAIEIFSVLGGSSEMQTANANPDTLSTLIDLGFVVQPNGRRISAKCPVFSF